MTVGDICAAIEEWAPPGLAFEGDPVGLSTGHPGQEARTVLVALTVTGCAIAMAKKRHADMIVSHHPLLFDPLKNLRVDNPHARPCLDLVKANIACFAAHTNLDIAPGGVNDILGDRIGLKNRQPLLPVPQNRQVKLVTFVPASHLAEVRDAICRAGAGRIGDYTYCTFSAPGEGTFLPAENSNPFSGEKGQLNEEPERRIETLVSEYRLAAVIDALKQAHPYEEAAYDVVPLANKDTRIGRHCGADCQSARTNRHEIGIGVQGDLERAVSLQEFGAVICDALEIAYARVVGDLKKKVKRVAILGGSGGGEIDKIGADIDVFVTGDVKYHGAISAAERGLALIDAGHAGTEKWIVPALVDYLQKRFEKLQVIPFTEPEIFQVVMPSLSDF